VISSFCSNNQGGIIDIKKELKFEIIFDNIFFGQGNEKVYIFKMLTKGLGSKVNLKRCMQPGGDLWNVWMMFNNFKYMNK